MVTPDEAARRPLQEITEAIAEDGFVVVRGLCGAPFVDRVLGMARRRAHAVQTALGTRAIGIGSAAGYEEIVQRSPGRWDVPVTTAGFGLEEGALPWSRVVGAVLGEDAEPSFSGVVFSDPHSPAQRWHTDSPHIEAAHLPPHALNIMVALHDIPIDMGPTEFARGSHRLTNHLANPGLRREALIYQQSETPPESLVQGSDRPAPESCAFAMRAGDGLIFDDRLLHRGLANRTDHTRYVAYFAYRRHGYAENTHFEAARSVFDGPAPTRQ